MTADKGIPNASTTPAHSEQNNEKLVRIEIARELDRLLQVMQKCIASAGSAPTADTPISFAAMTAADTEYSLPSSMPETTALLGDVAQAIEQHRAQCLCLPQQTTVFAQQACSLADTTPELLGPVVSFLLSIPVLGAGYAIRFLSRSTSRIPDWNTTLNQLAQHEQLLLVNEYFNGDHPPERPLGKWCDLWLTTKGSTLQHDEVLALLWRLHTTERPLNWQIKQQLSRYAMPEKCLAILSAPANPEQARQAACALCALGAGPGHELLTEKGQTLSSEIAHILLQAARKSMQMSPELRKGISHLLYHADAHVRTDAMRTLAVLDTPGMERLFILVIRKFPKDRHLLYPAMLLLNEDAFLRLLEMMPDKLRSDALGCLMHTIMLGTPDLAAGAITTARAILKGLDAATVAAVKKFLIENRKTPYFSAPAFTATEDGDLTADIVRLIPADNTGTFGLRKKRAADVERAFSELMAAGNQSVSNTGLKGLSLHNLTVADKAFTTVDMSECRFSGGKISNCTFKHVSFQNARHKDLTFTDCIFDAVDFSSAQLTHCTFIRCRFKATRIRNGIWKHCTMQHSRFDTLLAGGFIGNHLLFEECRILKSEFWGITLVKSTVTGSTIALTDFSASLFNHCTFNGAELHECSVTTASLEHCYINGTLLRSCSAATSRFRETLCDSPVLLETAEANRAEELIAATDTFTPQDVPVYCRKASALAQHMSLQCIRYRQTMHRRHRFLRQNVKRLDLAAKTLGPDKEIFFRLLPLLLGNRLFEKKHLPAKRFPLCHIAGYAPDYQTLQLCREEFETVPDTVAFSNFGYPKGYIPAPCGNVPQGSQNLQSDSTASSPAQQNILHCDAIYTIGSVGSVAMTADSDIDYWVCLSPEHYTKDKANALQRKLDAISHWGEERFGLETTFFVMLRDDIQANDFGESDKESSGSAQALLLKEEFYRSALKVCGKDLAWWAIPEYASENVYKEELRKHATLPFASGESFVDMGHLRPIPPDEYFGAALWQIVKAFNNPFKSVMKLGLLEAYLTEHSALLCETIKHHVVRRSSSLLETDPYVILLKALRDHYHMTGNSNAAGLLQTAFQAKLSGSILDKHEHPMILRLKQQALRGLYGDEEMPHAQNFDQAKELGRMLNEFFLRSYAALQEQLQQQHITARISPEDITRLGRKIFAAFAPKNGKIDRLPFINSMGRTIKELMFRKDTTPGARRKWIALGLPHDAPSRREEFVEIKRESDPVKLLAWIVANGIYYPDMHIDVDMSMTPMAAQDISCLLEGLRAHFPPEMFSVPAEQTLRQERVLRALCAPNLTLPRDTSIIKELSVIYCTNWGELFCTTLPVEDSPALANNARAYLEKVLPQAMSLDTAIESHIPYRSKTPRLRVF